MNLAETYSPAKLIGGLKVRLRLPGKADDYIGRDGNTRQGAAQSLHQSEVIRRCVSPSHGPQYGIIARLSGNMQMSAYARIARYDFDQLVADLMRIKRTQP